MSVNPSVAKPAPAFDPSRYRPVVWDLPDDEEDCRLVLERAPGGMFVYLECGEHAPSKRRFLRPVVARECAKELEENARIALGDGQELALPSGMALEVAEALRQTVREIERGW
ncbi:hypothetical protein [Calidithermus chliarophilus]|uniref:hypothetical protein n=1 Tax=Calidithermus chliarophilus TaxID=52023 RepID=UPI00041AAE03|nr:hypothetical protein [Calidithermus chliarophilus]